VDFSPWWVCGAKSTREGVVCQQLAKIGNKRRFCGFEDVKAILGRILSGGS